MASNPFITAEEDQILPGQVSSRSLTNTLLCLVLVPAIQERGSETREGQKEGYEDDQRDGQPLRGGKTEGLRSFLPGEEKTQGGPHHHIAVLKGWLQRGWRQALHKDPHGDDKGNRYKLHREMIHLNVKNEIFYCENNQQLPWGCGRVPITGDF